MLYPLSYEGVQVILRKQSSHAVRGLDAEQAQAGLEYPGGEVAQYQAGLS